MMTKARDVKEGDRIRIPSGKVGVVKDKRWKMIDDGSSMQIGFAILLDDTSNDPEHPYLVHFTVPNREYEVISRH